MENLRAQAEQTGIQKNVWFTLSDFISQATAPHDDIIFPGQPNYPKTDSESDQAEPKAVSHRPVTRSMTRRAFYEYLTEEP